MLESMMRARAAELLGDGTSKGDDYPTVARVLGWRRGEFFYDPTPAFFERAEALEELVYNGFAVAMLSKYLIGAATKEGRTLVFLRPCDTYGFNQLLSEHKIARDRVYIIGVGCGGALDIEKIRGLGIRGILRIQEEAAPPLSGADRLVIDTLYGDKTCARRDVLLEKCLVCPYPKGREHKVYDELIAAEDEWNWETSDRFAEVERLEGMTPDERFAFWRAALSRCIRCNACRNACPVCSCNQCVFDNARSGVAAKVNTDSFEENMFHIIRAFHVAGRCTDCGECSRVCPQRIPLHLLNRKFIRDINVLYGEYQAGLGGEHASPLTEYTAKDADPNVMVGEGGARR